jgi:hypothetical protein
MYTPPAYTTLLQPKKKPEKKYYGRGGDGGAGADDTPLDDPEAERQRLQRLEEEADFRCVCVGGDVNR